MEPIITLTSVIKKFFIKQKKGFWKDLFAPDFKELRAVDDLSLTIYKGEIVGFVGPNGAGKTTTLRMITGILHPTSGTIEVFAKNPQRERPHVVRDFGVVFGQRKSLWPDLNVRDGIELTAAFYDISKSEFLARYATLSDIFHLDEFDKSPFRKLSLGQQMRSELVAALIHKPKVLLLDEPTIGLDIVAKKELFDLLTKLHTQEKITILLTSHDLHDIERFCPRLVIINHGQKLYDGKTTDIIPSKVLVTYEYNNTIIQKHVEKKDLKNYLRDIETEDLTIQPIPLEEVITEYYNVKK